MWDLRRMFINILLLCRNQKQQIVIHTLKQRPETHIRSNYICLLQRTAAQRRIQERDVATAAKTWDSCLGAIYMRNQAIQMGVPPEAILVEAEALHTRENAEHVLPLLEKHHLQRVILVTSPFHQLRTYLTFAKVFQPRDINIINYYADTGEWHPATWFLRAEHRKLVKGEIERIRVYREKGDIL
jgi:uncharacterized SAM-binding protein YcdF (DUF218 family)